MCDLRFNSLGKKCHPTLLPFPGRELGASWSWGSLSDTGGPFERRTRSDDIAVPRSSRCGSLRPWASRPCDWGKGSLTLHSGRPLLRMGSDGEASGDKDIPTVSVAFT